jgi:hypothetical protein
LASDWSFAQTIISGAMRVLEPDLTATLTAPAELLDGIDGRRYDQRVSYRFRLTMT